MKLRHLAALGAAAAIATTGAVVLPSVASGAATRAATKGTVHFLITEGGSGTTNHATAILHGAINGGGTDVSKDNTNYDTIHLGGGTLRVSHPDKDSTFKQKVNPKTCYASISGSGTYTLGHGTGKYKGVTGSGHYTLTGAGFATKKNGKCTFSGDGGAFASYVTGSGPVTLP